MGKVAHNSSPPRAVVHTENEDAAPNEGGAGEALGDPETVPHIAVPDPPNPGGDE